VDAVWTGGDVVSPEAVRRVREVPADGFGNGTARRRRRRSRPRIRYRRGADPGHGADRAAAGQHEGLRTGTSGQVVPAGVAGELYVAGGGLRGGYWGGAALTADGSWPTPSVARRADVPDGTGAVRTDGQVEFVGRADDQVKLRGFRIELGEIEGCGAAAGGGPGGRTVREAARGTSAGGVCGAASGAEVDAAGLRAPWGAALPQYMVPFRGRRSRHLPGRSTARWTGRPSGPVIAPVTGWRPRARAACASGSCAAVRRGARGRTGRRRRQLLTSAATPCCMRWIGQVRSAAGLRLDLVAVRSPSGRGCGPLGEPAGPVRRCGGERPRWPAVFGSSVVVPGPVAGPGATFQRPVGCGWPGVGLRRAGDGFRGCRGEHEALRTVFAERTASRGQVVLDAVRPVVTESVVGDLDAALAAAVGHCFDLAVELPLRAGCSGRARPRLLSGAPHRR